MWSLGYNSRFADGDEDMKIIKIVSCLMMTPLIIYISFIFFSFFTVWTIEISLDKKLCTSNKNHNRFIIDDDSCKFVLSDINNIHTHDYFLASSRNYIVNKYVDRLFCIFCWGVLLKLLHTIYERNISLKKEIT